MIRRLSLAALATFLIAGLLDVPVSSSPWFPASALAPFGGDEFGRNHALVLIVSLGRSLALGSVLACSVIIIATSLAWLIATRQGQLSSALVRMTSLIIESVPIFLWILLAFAVLPDRGLLIASLALVIGLLPFATNVLEGEFTRLRNEAYVAAAFLSGASQSRILMRHILPNATSVLLPLFVVILGIAVAIPGAIGILGFGQRISLDLGMILLRGKESALTHPQIIIGAVGAFVVLYTCLYFAGRNLVNSLNSRTSKLFARL